MLAKDFDEKYSENLKLYYIFSLIMTALMK